VSVIAWKAGVAPCAVASVPAPKTTTGPPAVACEESPGTTWQLAQATAAPTEPPRRCTWWAPTTSGRPVVAIGGAAGRDGLSDVAGRLASP
jgi:hypothetical protein